MKEDIEKMAGRWHMGIIGAVIVLLIVLAFMLGNRSHTIDPAVRAVANGVPACNDLRRIVGGEPARISRLWNEEQERSWLLGIWSSVHFSNKLHGTRKLLLLPGRREGRGECAS
ncbi:MAG: hypothetical protein UY81_C0002G0009 [Candidatus Giovannonibacteria bacterium GW2011_GWA2_53_7]|uniref:Uncharacterized protein n=1 Tax=Candidatus Giovannonibacteria bacterium GW2011_GWA2_53_7 TaxID=1618650 RepID=A0A0G1Y1R8_9BACT|nr:MAG: hypothetical protein UY81_C0002G0009 [Candidatus Giovannonibacteria bacterium GW2011_GWA2_53_7]